MKGLLKEIQECPGGFITVVITSILFASFMAWISDQRIESERRWKEYEESVRKWRSDCITGGGQLVSYPYPVRKKYKKNKYHDVTRYTTRCER